MNNLTFFSTLNILLNLLEKKSIVDCSEADMSAVLSPWTAF